MDTLPKPIQDGLAFEQSNFVKGSCVRDPFYTVPREAEYATQGDILKIETDTDTSDYFIPPGIALSRIMYQSASLNGQRVPVSAVILWPYIASKISDGYPIVAWAHGTSGVTADCAPSHLKNVWQHFQAPFQLALQGFVVVATDYAGLGVSETYSKSPIIHEYLSFPSQANDVIYAVAAAQKAFDTLSRSFVVMGQSQGGGAAWACAQRQVNMPVDGYLGAVAVSPPTRTLDEPGEFAPLLGVGICPTVAATDAAFDMNTVLTPSGLQYLETVLRLGLGMGTAAALYLGIVQAGGDLLQQHWKDNKHIQDFQDRVQNGGKAIEGPLFVIHGENDPRISISVVSKAVKETVRLFPSSQLTYAALPEVSHVPALLAGQKLWMDWIARRFEGIGANRGFEQLEITPARSPLSYHKEQNWYLEMATEFYHAP